MKRKTLRVSDRRSKDNVYLIARDTYEKVTSKLSIYELGIYFQLLDATGSGTSQTDIAKNLKISRKKVSEGLDRLEKLKAIKRDKEGNIELLGA